MKRSFFWQASRFVALGAGVLISACEDTTKGSRYTAEEAGYFLRFRPVLDAICKIGTIAVEIENQLMAVPCTDASGASSVCPQVFPMPRNRPINRISDTGVRNSPVLLSLAKATLPPDGTDILHELLITGLNTEIDLDTGTSNPTMFTEAAKEVCQAYTTIQKNISVRVHGVQTTDSYYLAFKPPHFPAQLELDTRAGFTVIASKNISLSTPYGAVTVGYRSPPGIHNLVVRFRDKQRYFTLDRAFEFYLPAGFATKVSYAGTDELLITVEGL